MLPAQKENFMLAFDLINIQGYALFSILTEQWKLADDNKMADSVRLIRAKRDSAANL